MSLASPVFNIRNFGASGDGVTPDTSAINAAIQAAADVGAGRVVFPAGTYLSFSIHLRSHVTLHLEAGSVLLAATPGSDGGAYDAPEPNPWGDEKQYQDFGHSHWHNSLICGEGLTDVAITGPGRIDGRGLDSHLNYETGTGDVGPNGTATTAALPDRPSIPPSLVGRGNKAIALKNCQHVTLRDFSIHRGGHFAVLATGVDHLTIERLLIDTNRDGLDIDSCQHVTITHCTINTPADDAIVLKASYALGTPRACQDLTIRHCAVSGFDVGSVDDGTRTRNLTHAPDRDGPTGRIKIGTETNGDFRCITITDCTFERSRGIALETVDGGTIEDVTIANIAMREITNAPLFLRLGNRARGPEGTSVGRLLNVNIRDITATAVDGRFPIIIAGLPDHPIAQITLDNIRISSGGGITLADVAAQADIHVNPFFLGGDEPGVTGPRDPTAAAVPLRESAYPEPSMFGLLPAAGLYLRHVTGLSLHNVNIELQSPDERPLVIQDDVDELKASSSNLFPFS